MITALPYTKRGQQQRRQSEALSAVYKDFRRYYMRRRRDWNRIGHKVPLWFRLALRRIDHRLTLQFIPPRSAKNPDGVPSAWTHGAWYVCARIKRSQWLARRAVFVLISEDGKTLPPDRQLLRVLKHARMLRKHGDLDSLDKQYEEKMDALMREKEERSRNELLNDIVATMKKRNYRSRAVPRVLVPEIPV